MQPIVSSEQMKGYDEATITSYKTPGLLLMDRAGSAAAHLILQRFSSQAKRVAVVCGKGNNGGDGFVVARVLAGSGCDVTVFVTHPATSLSGDARKHFDIMRTIGNVNVRAASGISISKKGSFDLIVDAVFGTGFKGAPRGTGHKAISWMNNEPSPVVSLDIPSGIDATSGTAEGAYVSAAMTVSFGLLKTGLVLNQGREASGHTVAVDIGIPRALTHGKKADTFLVGPTDVKAALPRRPQSLHKYTAGKVLILAGSPGYTGAAALASHAALRSGAGAALVMTPASVHSILARKLTSEIVVPVPASPSGTLGIESLNAVNDRLSWADVILIGPGLSVNDDTTRFMEEMLVRWKGPTVIDADGLAILARSTRLSALISRRDWILTPHAGEFSRLTGMSAKNVDRERVIAARAYAEAERTTLVLKGAPTCTANKGGTVYINTTGNPGMATIGAGDVLAGLIAGLRAQKLASDTAAWTGVLIHGRSGDLAKDRLGERSVLASDILDLLPEAIRTISSEGTA